MVTDALPLAAHTVAFCIARQQSVRRPCTARSQWSHLTLHTLPGVHRHRQPHSHHILSPHTLSIQIPIKTHPVTYHIRPRWTWMCCRVHWALTENVQVFRCRCGGRRHKIGRLRDRRSPVDMAWGLCVVETHFHGRYHGNGPFWRWSILEIRVVAVGGDTISFSEEAGLTRVNAMV